MSCNNSASDDGSVKSFFANWPMSTCGLNAKAVEKDLPAKELHELLLLSLQWLSRMISLSNPVCPLQLLREIETKVWLLAVESETQVKSEGDFNLTFSTRESAIRNDSSIID
ncbi:hypothetical protein RYX36_032568 [Vicia faba]